MKKILFLAASIIAGTICFAQEPVTVKPAKTVIAPIDDQAKLENMKTEMIQLLTQYNKQLNAAQETMNKIEQKRKAFVTKMKELEAKDRMGNFEIQRLMSAFNQAETLSSSLLKKLADSKNAVIQKIN